MCHEIFYLNFFHDWNPSRPLINRLKYFRIRFHYAKIFEFFKAPQCASHPGARLCSVHHPAESSDPNFSKNFAVCITPRSQFAHCRVRIKNFVVLWLFLKGRSGEILVGVNTSIIKDFKYKKWFFELCDRISRGNRNQIRKYFTLFIRGPDGFESWKKTEVENLVTHSLKRIQSIRNK